jgi:PAS domain S-box-containing protein
MAWLAGGIVYSVAYLLVGAYLRGNAHALVWLRICGLLVPALAGTLVIARRRREWTGCQWLFWATIALGLSMTAIGIVGWTVDEVMLERETSWLGWYTVFALFGSIAPLFALLAQPHRGTREAVTASTAVDIAGIAVMTGFLYSHFVVGSDLSPLSARTPSLPLVLLQELQQFLVCAALVVVALAARSSTWSATYSRLAMGLGVSFAMLTISNLGILQGLYRAGGVYDVIWILPFAFFAWAAADAPGSNDEQPLAGAEAIIPSRPWVVFGVLGTLPLVDFGLRRVVPLAPSLEGFRDVSMVITIFSVLPLLMARLAVENADAQRADRRRLLLAAATEQADDLISIMTPEGKVEYANAAFCRALGVDADEATRMTATDFLADESRAQFDHIRTTVPMAHAWRGTFVRQRKDGSTFLSTSSVVALTDSGGRLTNFVAVERDTTHEAQLRDQLIHSERLAAVGQLVSGVAHELNNPLQSIVGFTDLLMSAERRPEVRSDLDQVHAAARRAAKIVHNLLAFVRRTSSERIAANLNAIVQSTVSLRRYELSTTGIELKETYVEDLPPVRVSPEEIQQIVLNLVLNAEQAMRGAGRPGRLAVRTLRESESKVAVEIQDDGPGVPPSLAGRIFEPFFSTKDVGEGTGLGLSLALGIAEAHGGNLALIPAFSGACFRLTLPIASSTSVATPVEPLPAPAPAAAAAEGVRRALIVDDEPALRKMLQRLLVRRGFDADVAEDGRAAVSLLEQNRYDVVFSDVQMPNMGGTSLLEWIRARQPPPASAFVFVMGGLVTPELQSAIASGRIPVLPKPFTAASLDALLFELFDEQPPRAAHTA